MLAAMFWAQMPLVQASGLCTDVLFFTCSAAFATLTEII